MHDHDGAELVTTDTDGHSAAGVFVLALFYLSVCGWLLLFVAVPALGWGMSPVVITSGSMEPGIRPGDVVMLDAPAPDRLLSPGSVIAFNDPVRPGELITHRVSGLTADGRYETQGDANDRPDSTPVSAQDVVGVAKVLVPVVGQPVVWLQQALGFFVIWAAVTVAACVLASRPPGRRAVP